MLTDEQLAFLAREEGVILESIKNTANTNPDYLMGACADIIVEEIEWDEAYDKRFNPERLAMAESVIKVLM